jgi:hypothetical protein
MNYSRNALRYETVDIDWLKPSPHHARIHPARQIKKLAELLAKFGQVIPLPVAPNGELIDGHVVWQVLRDAGQDKVEVVIVADQSPDNLRALRLALNRSSQEACWDKGKLRTEMQHLFELSFDLELTGFEEHEIEILFATQTPSANVIEEADAIPPPPKTAVSQTGDIYEAGCHRIACGNALDRDFLHRVRGDRLAAASFFDANCGLPRNLSRNKNQAGITAGKMSSVDIFQYFQEMLDAARTCSHASGLIFACTSFHHSLEITTAARLANFPLLNICVCVKSKTTAGTVYGSQHEFMHLFKAGNQPHRKNIHLARNGRSRSDVWHYADVSSRCAELPDSLEAKPVQLLIDALRDVTKRRDTIFDISLGLGSTLLAAEETGRVCFGIERDPRFTDVVIERWQRATGRDAILLRTGETFNERFQRGRRSLSHEQ